MQSRLKQAFSVYFNSWWMPSAWCAVTVVVLRLLAFLRFGNWEVILMLMVLPCLLIAFLGILCAGFWNLIKKRWTSGSLNLVILPVCVVFSFFALRLQVMGSVVLIAMLGPSEDGFSNNLAIPANVEVAEPLDQLDAVRGGVEDSFQQSILKALATAGNDDPTVTADIAMLLKIHQGSPELLMRFLATSPSWRVFKEHGNLFATRRWMVGSQWQYTMHGYYTRHDIDMWNEAKIPDFQTRLTIGFSGKPWAGTPEGATQLDPGQTSPLKLSTPFQKYGSLALINSKDLVVEVFEQTEREERRLTKAALSCLADEMGLLDGKPDWTTICSLLPPEWIKHGGQAFELRNSFQPGIYDSQIWVNPAEPGMIYLKAFEITKGTPLSVRRLKDASNEWIGWSDNPDELFFSNSNFTIGEGDWGKPYAARFEVWFAPDSGIPERKLMDKAFRIEGWQR